MSSPVKNEPQRREDAKGPIVKAVIPRLTIEAINKALRRRDRWRGLYGAAREPFQLPITVVAMNCRQFPFIVGEHAAAIMKLAEAFYAEQINVENATPTELGYVDDEPDGNTAAAPTLPLAGGS
jgi:hypothetical protein